MKKYTTLFAGLDNKSYFKEDTPIYSTKEPLGLYSKKIKVNGILFRMFEPGSEFNWHTAPQPQYIVYLDGEVEVEASGGEKRIFRQGDVLFATDTTGKGHITRTLTAGNSIVITTQDETGTEIESTVRPTLNFIS